MRVTGNLKVPKDASCTLISVTVQGDIQANEAANLLLNGVSVGRNVDIDKADSVLILATRIKNDLHVHEVFALPPASSGFVRNVICNTVVGHDLHVEKSRTPFGIGDDLGCGDPGMVTVGHDAVVNDNKLVVPLPVPGQPAPVVPPSVVINRLAVVNNLRCEKNVPMAATSDGVSAGHDNKCQLTLLTLPSVTATAWPPADAGNWNHSDVTVSFSCAAQSGVAACSPSVTVTTEGPNQIITGTVVDKAGQVVTKSITLNIDKVPPPSGSLIN